MKLTLSTILALSALALSIPVAELRKRDLGGNHTEEECEKAFESLKQDEKTKDYDFKNLFWVPMESVCSKVDVVIYGSKILSKHCTQTVNEDSPFQSAAIYEAWSNTEAALGACQMSSESRYCVDEVLYSSMDVDTLTKEVGCTTCQRAFWKPILGNLDLAPSTYYWSIVNKKNYVNKLTSLCGKDFFL
ncbi:hypothetical protein HDU92_000047 [Lobulomyces angularis]|nr:hypothetical protein HDU92_000047 [Lobulomyces angularis]